MTTTTRTDPYDRARAQAADAFAQHQMTVMHEDGVYRHLRFQRPESWMYGFDIVTWPGHLYVGGDIEDFTFARIHDMADFFDMKPDINPHYWAEKITSRGGRVSTRVYEEARLHQRVTETFDELAEIGYEPEDVQAIRDAWAAHIATRELHYEDAAREALREFGPVQVGPYRGFEFYEPIEWDLCGWDQHYLLSCFAIVHGLAMWKARP